jgi:hypothetical protein
MFFPRFEYHIFYVLYSFVTYLLILPRKIRKNSKLVAQSLLQEVREIVVLIFNGSLSTFCGIQKPSIQCSIHE